MCLCGAALRGDARSSRVPEPREATEFHALAFRETLKIVLVGPKLEGKSAQSDKKSYTEAQNQNDMPKTAARAVHVMQNRAGQPDCVAISLL